MPRSERRAVLLVAVTTPLGLIVAGCGSSSSGDHPAAASGAAPPICTQVADVLGDGPDPDSDPVGYAEAQVGPLAALHPSDSALRAAVTRLDTAYRNEFTVGVSTASKKEVTAAKKQINSLCPGAAS